MAAQEANLSLFDKWKRYIDQAKGNPEWDKWDCEIQRAVSEYNHHLADTEGYVRLDWRYIKAIIWVESGAGKPDWNKKPMQIGNMGDPGLDALLADKGDRDDKGNEIYEAGDLVMPPGLKEKLQLGLAKTIPAYNIRAGIGYLLMRAKHYEYRSTPSAGNTIYKVKVKSGDNASNIAKTYGTTVAMLEKLNPEINISNIRPGMILKYQRASIKPIITGWRPMSIALIKELYNSPKGDSSYKRKLDYVWPLILNRGMTICKS